MEYGHRNGSDWCVIAQSSVETEPESVNRQQNKDSKDRFNCKKKNEPVLTASQILKEHPFEIKQEDEVPELAAAIPFGSVAFGHTTVHLQYFGPRHQPEIGLVNLMWSVEIHCLEVLSSE